MIYCESHATSDTEIASFVLIKPRFCRSTALKPPGSSFFASRGVNVSFDYIHTSLIRAERDVRKAHDSTAHQ